MKKVFTVRPEQSAKQVGSGELEVLASPVLLAYMENVASEICLSHCQGSETTVGIEVDFKHLAPSAVGSEITIDADIKTIKKNVISLVIQASDQNGQTVGEAKHKRAIVNTEKFMAKLK